MPARINASIAALSDYDARDMRDDGVRVRLHRNESALPPPAHIVDAVRNLDGESLRTYPVELQRRFVTALAKRLNTQPERVAIGNGADELLAALTRAFVSAGDNVLTVTPTFGMYARTAAMAGAELRTVSYARRWEIDPQAFVERADDRTKLVIVGHPNNPTGDALRSEHLAFLSRSLPHATIAVDEIYLTLGSASLLSFANSLANVAVIGSLSKIAALAGLRVGYAVAEPQLAAALRRVIPPYPLSVAALAAANAYVCGGPLTAAYDVALQAQVARSLDAIVFGIGPFARWCWRGPASFVLMDFGDIAKTIAAKLAERGIAVRTYDTPELKGAIRFCAANDEVTDELIATVRGIVRVAYA